MQYKRFLKGSAALLLAVGTIGNAAAASLITGTYSVSFGTTCMVGPFRPAPTPVYFSINASNDGTFGSITVPNPSLVQRISKTGEYIGKIDSRTNQFTIESGQYHNIPLNATQNPTGSFHVGEFGTFSGSGNITSIEQDNIITVRYDFIPISPDGTAAKYFNIESKMRTDDRGDTFYSIPTKTSVRLFQSFSQFYRDEICVGHAYGKRISRN